MKGWQRSAACVLMCWALCAGCSDDADPATPTETGATTAVTSMTSTSGSGQTNTSSFGEDVGGSDVLEDVESDAVGEDIGADSEPDLVEDTEPEDGGTEDAGTGGKCAFENPVSPDAPRLVAVGHGFSAELGVDGTRVRLMTLSVEEGLTDLNISLDSTLRPARLAFVPDGSILLVLGEHGTLVAMRDNGDSTWDIASRVELPSAGYGDLVVAENGRRIHVIGNNVDETSGISTVSLSCEGILTIREDTFFNRRLSVSLALDTHETQGVLLGGQTIFEPIDDNDVRLVSWTGDGWTETAALDIFGDYIDAGRIALSPDGTLAMIPNGSPFSEEGNQLAVVQIDGAESREVARILDLVDAREVVFSPDGRTALVTLFEPGRVAVLSAQSGVWVEVDRIAGIGLPEHIVMLRRGPLSGTALIPSIDGSSGSNIAILRVTGEGTVEDQGQRDLGESAENIPTAIGVVP